MRRKPTASKLLAGTLRPDRVNPLEPKPPVGLPSPRPDLPPAVLIEYERLEGLLAHMPGVATVVDVVQIELTASALAEYRAAHAVVLEKGPTYEAKTSSRTVLHRVRPEVAIAASAWQRAHTALQCLGLSPTSRAKVSGAAPTPTDAFSAYRNVKLSHERRA